MKNLKILAILTALIIGTQIAIAIQPVSINEPQLVNENTAIQAQQSNDNLNKLSPEKFAVLGKRYRNNMYECVPFHFNQYIDFFGLKIAFNIDINGWVNNKCEYKISGQVKSIGKDIREVYDVKATDEQIARFQPRVECYFDKAQLAILVDGLFSTTKEQSAIGKMLESPEKKLKNKTQQLTPEEEKLAAMIMTENVCSVPNKEDLMKQLEEFIKPNTPAQ